LTNDLVLLHGGCVGIVERKEREKEQRKNDIVDAAERVFFKKGHENATMDDVAEEAELSKGTLYLYFKNKEELYLAIHLRGNKILHDFFVSAVKNANTGIEKTRAIGNAYVEFFKKHPDYFNAMLYFESREIDFEDQESVAAECLIEGKATLEILIESIIIGTKDGTIRPDIDPIKAALNLWGQTTGVLQTASLKERMILMKNFNLTAQDVIDYCFDLIYHSLKA
jgi:AcrR family transcriptional regulator